MKLSKLTSRLRKRVTRDNDETFRDAAFNQTPVIGFGLPALAGRKRKMDAPLQKRPSVSGVDAAPSRSDY